MQERSVALPPQRTAPPTRPSEQEPPPSGRLHFPDLSIRGFRGIADLHIPQLGRATLLTGENNTGKSSILEALRLHTQNADPHVVYSILESREEYTRGADRETRSSDPNTLFHASAMFHGFPRLSEDFGPIIISTRGGVNHIPVDLTMRVAWFAEVEDEAEDSTIGTRLVAAEDVSSEEPADVPALVVETEERRRVYRLEAFRRYAIMTRRSLFDEGRIPCIWVSPYAGQDTDALGDLWDEIALTDHEKDVVDALRIIDPKISAVSIVGSDSSSRTRTRKAIVRSDNLPRPVQLRSFGDGMSRIFAIVLSLVNAKGGLLLIDEFENGLHHSVQLGAWRMIFRLAQSLDVQVFATTHSKDAVEAFQEAAAETPELGVLVRLKRRGDAIIPTVVEEEDLGVAIRHDIEVRGRGR